MLTYTLRLPTYLLRAMPRSPDQFILPEYRVFFTCYLVYCGRSSTLFFQHRYGKVKKSGSGSRPNIEHTSLSGPGGAQTTISADRTRSRSSLQRHRVATRKYLNASHTDTRLASHGHTRYGRATLSSLLLARGTHARCTGTIVRVLSPRCGGGDSRPARDHLAPS